MQVLRAVNKYSDSAIIALADIYSLNDNLRDSNFQNTFQKSLNMKGMLNPILVSTEQGFKTNTHPFDRRPQPEHIEQISRCMIGNTRNTYAVDNGSTHIECIIIDH